MAAVQETPHWTIQIKCCQTRVSVKKNMQCSRHVKNADRVLQVVWDRVTPLPQTGNAAITRQSS